MKTMLSIASRQIWPHILSVTHLRPAKLILLHTADAEESKTPAQRLKRFFNDTGLMPPGTVELKEIPHDDFAAIESTFDGFRLNLGETVLNFTGGNKLMATAAFRWAARRSVPSFYLERGFKMTRFSSRDGDIRTESSSLDPALTNSIDPLQIIRCQIQANELSRDGQILKLNRDGNAASIEEIEKRITHGADPQKWLVLLGSVEGEKKEGDRLEFVVGLYLLKLGVPIVRRSIMLKVKSAPGVSTRRDVFEFDLTFNWGGRVWLVDCKDRRDVSDLTDGIRRYMRPDQQGQQLLDRIQQELGISQTKAIQQDILAVREIGGLLGQAICVRRVLPEQEVLQFAKHHGIPMIAKESLLPDLRKLLFANKKLSREELQAAFRSPRPP